MRVIKHTDYKTVENPIYMAVGEENICVSFPGSNVDDPQWAHAEILKRTGPDTYELEEVRIIDLTPTGSPIR